MTRCPFCENEAYGTHIYHCDEKPEGLTEKSEIKKQFVDSKAGFEVTADWLFAEYHERNNSYTDISEDLGISLSDVKFLLEHLDVPKKDPSEFYEQAKQKRRKTMLEKYGAENPSSLEWVKSKKRRTFLKNYGVDNIFKKDGFREWVDDIMRERHGKGSVPNKNGNGGVDFHDRETRKKLSCKMREWWDSLSEEQYEKRCSKGKQWWQSLSDEEKAKHVDKVISNQKYESSLETKFAEQVLDPIGINDYEDQCFIAGKAFDFYIPDRSLLLEVNGDFWHANPEIYDASDLISYPGGEVRAETVWQRDETKKGIAEDRGYDVAYVWEREMEQDINSVRERVKSLL